MLSFSLGHVVHYVAHISEDGHFHTHTHVHNHHHSVHDDHHHSEFVEHMLDIVGQEDLSRLRYLSMLMSTLKCALPNASFRLFFSFTKVKRVVQNVAVMKGVILETPTPPPRYVYTHSSQL